MHDVLVIGAGLIGAAACRHLAEAGVQTVLIGPAEPSDYASHDGVFASHYDAGRITRALDKNLVWGRLAQRAMARYADLEAASERSFHTPSGFLRVDGDVAQHRHVAAIGQQLGVPFEAWTDTTMASAFPMLAIPPGYMGLYEQHGAGHINPRTLVDVQIQLACQHGATLIRETVAAVQPDRSSVAVHTTTGACYRAKRVLIAAGAFTNRLTLLPRMLALDIRPESVLLLPVSDDLLPLFETMPALWVDFRGTPIPPHVYAVPPVRYPDGQYYLKIGADHDRDVPFASLSDYQRFFRQGGSPQTGDLLRRVADQLFPALHRVRSHVKPCILTYSPHGYPMIDQVDERLFVAVAGNGGGAKSSDELGRIAALLVQHGSWHYDLDAANFRAV